MLLTGRLSYEDKLRMLLWISGLELKVLDLKYIPSEILVSTISLLCLIQAKSMNIAEAGCMIKSIVDVNRSPIEYPKRINARAFQLSFLHSKIFFYLTACNVAVGLRDFEVFIAYWMISTCSIDIFITCRTIWSSTEHVFNFYTQAKISTNLLKEFQSKWSSIWRNCWRSLTVRPTIYWKLSRTFSYVNTDKYPVTSADLILNKWKICCVVITNHINHYSWSLIDPDDETKSNILCVIMALKIIQSYFEFHRVESLFAMKHLIVVCVLVLAFEAANGAVSFFPGSKITGQFVKININWCKWKIRFYLHQIVVQENASTIVVTKLKIFCLVNLSSAVIAPK